MNAILSGTQFWYCDFFDKTINIKIKSKHFFCVSKTQKHKEKHGTVVKKYEFIKADIG